jgi:hypothetical protein
MFGFLLVYFYFPFASPFFNALEVVMSAIIYLEKLEFYTM